MKYLTVLLSIFLSSCVITKSAGGFDVSGRVVDTVTNAPVEGVKVFLRYSAVSFWGDHSKESGHTVTNREGKFFIPSEKVRLWGGTGGGLDGAIDRWPMVYLEKKGYLSIGVGNVNPSPLTYQNMQISIEPRGDK